MSIVRVSVYEDAAGRQFVDVEGQHEPELPTGGVETVDHTRFKGRRVRVEDLPEHDLVVAGDQLVWDRPRVGEHYEAVIAESGAIEQADGRGFSSPNRAAMEAAGVASYDGWYAWTVARQDLSDLRKDLVNQFG